MSLTKVLKREQKECPAEVLLNEGSEELAQRAARYGYNVLKEEARVENNAALHNQKVKKAFDAVGVRPFSKESVAKYKKKKIRETRRSMPSVWAAQILHPAVAILAWLFMVAMFGYAIYVSIHNLPATPFVISGVLGVIMACLATVSFCIGMGEHETYQTVFLWRRELFSEYRGRVPEFAIQTACDIKDQLPEAVICIDELVVDRVSRDPFLVISDGHGNDYYVEVWNEPKFEAKREV